MKIKNDYLINGGPKPSVEDFGKRIKIYRKNGPYDPSQDRIGKKDKENYSILLFKPAYDKNFGGYYIGVTVKATSLKKAKQKVLSKYPGYFFKEAKLV